MCSLRNTRIGGKTKFLQITDLQQFLRFTTGSGNLPRKGAGLSKIEVKLDGNDFHLHVCSTSTCRSNLTPFSHSRSQCMLLWETWDTPLMWPRCTSSTVCVLFKFNSNIPLLTCWRLSILSLILVLRTMIIYLRSVHMVFGRHLHLCDQETRPTSLS